MEKQKQYNLRYLLAKVRTTRGKASDRLRQLANKRNKRPCRTSSDIGAELENHTVGRGPTYDRKGLKYISGKIGVTTHYYCAFFSAVQIIRFEM
jgi:hypothetical protein